MFKKYQHIERFNTDETENINLGLCYVFSKIDGTCGSIWYDNEIKFASRRRELTLDNDNQEFMNRFIKDERIIQFFNDNKNLIIYGEFLIPHSLRTYRQDAWNKFYIFDIMNEKDEYLIYEDYQVLCEKYNLDYIPCLVKVENGSFEQFINIMNSNNYLIQDGKGIGEGIVIKRYDYFNKYGRKTWAKIVTSEFKEKHIKEMGSTYQIGKKIIEEYIIETYLTETLIEKTFQKIKNENDGWNSKKIPMLLGVIWHDFIIEEIWEIIKDNKNLKIDFKILQWFLNKKIKEIKEDLF
jgi:hypothetical protein